MVPNVWMSAVARYGLGLAKLASPLFENQRLSPGRRRVEISTRRSAPPSSKGRYQWLQQPNAVILNPRGSSLPNLQEVSEEFPSRWATGDRC